MLAAYYLHTKFINFRDMIKIDQREKKLKLIYSVSRSLDWATKGDCIWYLLKILY